MCKRTWNKRVSLTLNNRDSMSDKYAFMLVTIFFIIHLVSIYASTKFVWNVLSNDNPIAEGMVIIKILMWLMIYVMCILLGMLVTGFPAIADWADKKSNSRQWKIRLI